VTYRFSKRSRTGTKFVFDPSFLMQALPFVTNYLSGWAQNKLSGVSGNKSDILKQAGYVLDFLHAAVDSGEFGREAKEAEQTLEALYDDVMSKIDRDGNLPDDIINDKAFDAIVEAAGDAVSALDEVQDFAFDKIDDLKELFSSEKSLKATDPMEYAGPTAAADFLNDWLQDLNIGFDYEFEPDDFKGTFSQTDEILDMLAANVTSRELQEIEIAVNSMLVTLQNEAKDWVTFRVMDNLRQLLGSAQNYKKMHYRNWD
jgi:hypothetical protein